MKWLMGMLALVGLGMFLKSELPAMKRYLKIERM
jgi:hypothetical protein